MEPIPAWYVGGDMSWAAPPGDKVHGALDAWDPMTGKKKWSVRDDYPRISTVLSTKGGLVFSGDMKGNLYAYDADNGNQVWKFNMGSACRGGIISYESARPAIHHGSERDRGRRAGRGGERASRSERLPRRRNLVRLQGLRLNGVLRLSLQRRERGRMPPSPGV